MLIVLTGVRGAGKTTLINKLREAGVVKILQPSTTRKPRDENDTEYDFVNRWISSNFAWTIDVGDQKYGFRKSEVAKAMAENCVAVFDPLNIQVLKDYAATQQFETVIFGLDTIANAQEQTARVNEDGRRIMSATDFQTAKAVVESCDLVLKGDEHIVFKGALAAIEILTGRGGLITDHTIKPLIAAGTLLIGSKATAIQQSSYDLDIGEQVWCNRQSIVLSDDAATFHIPPYSYAIVTAHEDANLPTFIAANFDIKVSLFLRGVILSNGPQVDPGYRGKLFCMLFNSSSAVISLTKGTHFATIQFVTTSRRTSSYKAQYQLEQSLARIMSESGLSGPGGNIIADYDRKISDLDSRLASLQNPHWPAILTILGIALAIALVPVAWTYTLVAEARAFRDEAIVARDALERTRENASEGAGTVLLNAPPTTDPVDEQPSSSGT